MFVQYTRYSSTSKPILTYIQSFNQLLKKMLDNNLNSLIGAE